MRALLDNLASGDHSNRVRVLNCCELVGYDKGRTINSDFVKSILDDFLRLGIEGTCRFIKQQNLGIRDNGSCNSDALTLTTR